MKVSYELPGLFVKPRNTSKSVYSSSLLSAPVHLYFHTLIPAASPIKLPYHMAHFLHPSPRLRPNPIPSYSHLSNLHPPLAVFSLRPPIYPILLLLAWLIAETGPALRFAACKKYPSQVATTPALNNQPLLALITLHCQEIISGCDQILKHDGPHACVQMKLIVLVFNQSCRGRLIKRCFDGFKEWETHSSSQLHINHKLTRRLESETWGGALLCSRS